MDFFGGFFDGSFELAFGDVDVGFGVLLIGGVDAFVGFDEALVIFDGEFRVDRQEEFLVFFFSGDFDGEFDALRGIFFDGGVLFILGGREILLDDGAKLDFADISTGFDVGEDFFEVADTAGEILHFAEAFLDFV